MPKDSSASGYATNVFINCPFDVEFEPLFHAIVFAVIQCGYTVRCALEADDAGATRIDRIYRLIKDCRFGVHDISRIEHDTVNNLPRFNMPFELGLFLGARRFGARPIYRRSTRFSKSTAHNERPSLPNPQRHNT